MKKFTDIEEAIANNSSPEIIARIAADRAKVKKIRVFLHNYESYDPNDELCPWECPANCPSRHEESCF